MYALHIGARASQRLQILCVGAHCDDIEIGCGGTLLALQKRYTNLRVHWLVVTSGAERRPEALRSVQRFVSPRVRGEIMVHDLPDGRLPACFADVKALFEECRNSVAPDLVFTHHAADRHQDHALLSEVTWQTFRDHQIWEYEIPKWDADLATPNAYVPLPQGVAERKAKLIINLFESQRGKSWFQAENLLSLMRLRGLECRSSSGFAEGFHARKLVFALSSPGFKSGR